jgi:HAMP domain-containing protein
VTVAARTLGDLARSSTLRLVGAVAAVFLAAAVVLAVAVWSTVSAYIERRILDTIRTDLAGLEAVWRESGEGGLVRVVERRHGETGPEGHRRVRLVVSAAGDKIAGDFAGWPNDLPPTGEIVRFRDPEGGVAYTGMVRRIAGGPDLLVAHDRAEHEAVMASLTRDLALPIAAALVIAVLVTVAVGRRLLERVERVNATARAVEAGDLAARVGQAGDDEFGRLARHVDAMLDRIATLMRGVHHLSDQIAHETRTPLARLRARLERARREAEADPTARDRKSVV